MAKEKPRKNTRNPLGSILKKKVTQNGRKVTVFDARKRYTNAQGNPDEKFKRCATEAEAAIQLVNFNTQIKQELELPAAVKSNDHTFFELCDYYEREFVKEAVIIDDIQIEGYRQNLDTIKGYIAEYKEFITDKPVRDVRYEDIRRLRVHFATKPIKQRKEDAPPKYPKISTVNKKLGPLRYIFNIGISLGWLDRNPFTLGKPLIEKKLEIPKNRALSFEEENALIAACVEPDSYSYTRNGKEVVVKNAMNRRPHLRLIVIFALDSGMRRKEMFTTARKQVDFDTGIINLNAIQTKALKRRTIPISERLETELKTLFSNQCFEPDDLIFAGVKNVGKAFRTACRIAGIEGVTFHTLRHTAITWLDDAGVARSARHNFVGHEDERTHATYINVTPDVIRSAKERMNEFRRKADAWVKVKVKEQKAASQKAA